MKWLGIGNERRIQEDLFELSDRCGHDAAISKNSIGFVRPDGGLFLRTGHKQAILPQTCGRAEAIGRQTESIKP
jgi:hypothetical protein